MSPGPVEEVGKAASGFMTAMSSQPVMLGMVVIVMSQIGMLYYVARGAADLRKNEIELIYRQQKEVQELLSRCIVPPRGDTGLPRLGGVFDIPMPRPRPPQPERGE
jgi:hypothetical protein